MKHLIKIVKRAVPLVMEGELNRTKGELVEAMGSGASSPFEAPRTYQIGDVIVRGGKAFVAQQVIIAGETVRPGVNCVETTIETIINALQAKEE